MRRNDGPRRVNVAFCTKGELQSVYILNYVSRIHSIFVKHDTASQRAITGYYNSQLLGPSDRGVTLRDVGLIQLLVKRS